MRLESYCACGTKKVFKLLLDDFGGGGWLGTRRGHYLRKILVLVGISCEYH